MNKEYILMECDSTIAFRLPKAMHKSLKKVAKKKGAKVQPMMRLWVIEKLKEEEKT